MCSTDLFVDEYNTKCAYFKYYWVLTILHNMILGSICGSGLLWFRITSMFTSMGRHIIMICMAIHIEVLHKSRSVLNWNVGYTWKKMKQKIMSALGLDKDSHNISMVYRAPQRLVSTQVFYNSIQLLCDDDVDIIWAVIKWTPQFIASDLYVTVDAIRFNVDGGL